MLKILHRYKTSKLCTKTAKNFKETENGIEYRFEHFVSIRLTLFLEDGKLKKNLTFRLTGHRMTLLALEQPHITLPTLAGSFRIFELF